MRIYHEHYAKKDVLLLDDVFEKFIDTCLKFYKLDPCHFFSSAGLIWYGLIKMNKKKLFDIDMYFFTEKELKGGILTLLKDTEKQIKNTWKIIIPQNRENTYRTLIWIIGMVEQWVVIFLMMNVSG